MVYAVFFVSPVTEWSSVHVGDEQESPEIGVADGEFILRLKLVATLLSVKFTLTRHAEIGTSDVITGLFGFVCASVFCVVCKKTPSVTTKKVSANKPKNRFGFILFIIASEERKMYISHIYIFRTNVAARSAIASVDRSVVL